MTLTHLVFQHFFCTLRVFEIVIVWLLSFINEQSYSVYSDYFVIVESFKKFQIIVDDFVFKNIS